MTAPNSVFPLPTVAAVTGHAFGAGAFLALSCDWRVQDAARGWMCFPEVDLGLALGDGAWWFACPSSTCFLSCQRRHLSSH
jgi:enoyl-CoA hydratase/carnithine racemase